MSDLRIEFYAVVELPGGERVTVPLDALTHEETVETDIFDEGLHREPGDGSASGSGGSDDGSSDGGTSDGNTTDDGTSGGDSTDGNTTDDGSTDGNTTDGNTTDDDDDDGGLLPLSAD